MSEQFLNFFRLVFGCCGANVAGGIEGFAINDDVVVVAEKHFEDGLVVFLVDDFDVVAFFHSEDPFK